MKSFENRCLRCSASYSSFVKCTVLGNILTIVNLPLWQKLEVFHWLCTYIASCHVPVGLSRSPTWLFIPHHRCIQKRSLVRICISICFENVATHSSTLSSCKLIGATRDHTAVRRLPSLLRYEVFILPLIIQLLYYKSWVAATTGIILILLAVKLIASHYFGQYPGFYSSEEIIKTSFQY